MNEVIIYNVMFENFSNHPAMQKLIGAENMSVGTKFRVYKFVEKIFSSEEARAFMKMKEDLVKKKNPDGQEVTLDDPEVQEFLSQDSGLRVEKMTITGSDLPDNFSVADMMALAVFFNFEE